MERVKLVKMPSPHSSVNSVVDLRTGGHWFKPSAQPVFFPRNDDSHCDRIHSSLTAVHRFDNGYVEKQPVAWREYCAAYWLKNTRKSLIGALTIAI